MLTYQAQDCTATLAEGIGAYYGAHPFLKRGAALSAEAQEFFWCHDAVHVVYGCDTSLPHEAIVKLSSFFGTTEGLGVMRGYRLYESLDIYRELRTADKWAAFDAFMNVPLRDIRADFRIRVAT